MSAENVTPARRSSRLKGKARPSYADLGDELEEPAAGPSTAAQKDYKPPAKRPRKSVSKANADQAGTPAKAVGPRGRRRTLSKLVDMPLDILFEVFGHLHPYDLLQLSRTTKALRNILMHRSAITIWRNARQNVEDLPDCPPDLTEPAYANLLFDHHCHFCVRARVMTVLWTSRVRACKPCLKEHFTPLFDLLVAAAEHLPGPRQLIETSSMVPLEYHNHKLYVRNDHAQELLERIKACKGDEAALKELENERTAAANVLKDSAVELTEWQIKQNTKRTIDLYDLRERRRKQIVERLCQLGYGEDLQWMTSERVEQFIEHPLVKQAKELTDRIWNNIKAPMIAFALEARTERLMRLRCAHYINRLALVRDIVVPFLVPRPMHASLPSVADFSYWTPDFRHMLGEPRDTFYGPLQLPEDELDELLRESVKEWRGAMARRLFGMIRDAERAAAPATTSAPASTSASVKVEGQDSNEAGPSAGTSIVTPSAPQPDPTPEQITARVCSACTWFRCTNTACGALLEYPRVLAHRCAHAPPPVNLHPTTDAEDLRNAYALVLEELPWNFAGDAVVYDLRAQAAAEKVVRACGRDPGRTHGWEMERTKARLVCSLCSVDGQACVMTWKRAVAHVCDHAAAGQDAKLTRLSKRDARIVRRLEPLRLAPFFSCVYKMWGCVRCHVGPPMTMVEVFEHCMDEHGIDTPWEEDDYDVHPDAEAERGVPAHDVFWDASLFLTPIRR
ncbi:hypothetical protein OH77DRAFT_1416699 [Trametes cingulata]|nr:hypothetical protein OH77DRAFT_1416699 [Trametes cingulata]